MQKSLLILALLSCSVMAAVIDSHSVSVEMDPDGNAQVTEQYSIRLEYWETESFEALRNQSAAGSEAWMWQRIDPGIDMRVLGQRSSVVILAQGGGSPTITMKYSIPNFAKIISEEGRFVTRGVFMNQFDFYDQTTGLMRIPAGTTLELIVDNIGISRYDYLKDYFEVRPDIPGAETTLSGDNVYYRVKGEQVVPEFSLIFKEEKGIGESWGLARLLEGVGRFFRTNTIYGLVIVIIAVLILIYRKEIFGLISESFAGEEEVELPKKEK